MRKGRRMKAVVLRSFGGPEQLVFEDVPDPKPLSDEIVVKVATVSINRSFDLAVRKGTYSRGAVLPLVLGADPSGTVCAVGDNVHTFKIADRVAVMSTIACGQCVECRRGAGASCGFSRTIGVHRWGGYAEYVAVPASNAALIPEGLGFDQATVNRAPRRRRIQFLDRTWETTCRRNCPYFRSVRRTWRLCCTGSKTGWHHRSGRCRSR